jgi:hypothetical protein
MIAVFFSILVVLALLSICSDFIMRVRLSKRELPADRLLWWRRGGDDMDETYQELFPRSRLPLFRKCAVSLVLISALAIVIFVLWRRN